jgi:hypothetical protein
MSRSTVTAALAIFGAEADAIVLVRLPTAADNAKALVARPPLLAPILQVTVRFVAISPELERCDTMTVAARLVHLTATPSRAVVVATQAPPMVLRDDTDAALWGLLSVRMLTVLMFARAADVMTLSRLTTEHTLPLRVAGCAACRIDSMFWCWCPARTEGVWVTWQTG